LNCASRSSTWFLRDSFVKRPIARVSRRRCSRPLRSSGGAVTSFDGKDAAAVAVATVATGAGAGDTAADFGPDAGFAGRDLVVPGTDWLAADDATGALGAASGAATFAAGASGSVTGAEAVGCGGAGDSAADPASVAAAGAAAWATGDSALPACAARLACVHAVSKMIMASAATRGVRIARCGCRPGTRVLIRVSVQLIPTTYSKCPFGQPSAPGP